LRDISKGISLFNDSDFFSAHDFFEDCWVKCDRNEKLFFQGMVQISVGSYHLLNENYKGCLSQYRKGTAKLKNFKPVYHNIDLEKLVNEIEILIAFLSEGNSKIVSNILRNKIPKIEING